MAAASVFVFDEHALDISIGVAELRLADLVGGGWLAGASHVAYHLGSAVDVATWSVNLAVDVRECAVGWADGVYLGVQGRSCQGSTAGVSW
jgi:hypothetical protein